MNKFFKRLALLLAVLMIVSMMPVQLFADNSVTGEEQSNGTGEASGNSNAVAKIGDTGYESLEAALAAVTNDSPLTWVDESVWPKATPVYYNGNFYAGTSEPITAKGALEYAIIAANDANSDEIAKIYVRPGYNADGTDEALVKQAHQQIKTSIAIYGNDASLNYNWEPCVEKPGNSADDGAHQLTKDISIALYNLNGGAGLWGTRVTNYKVDLTMENCKKAYEIMFYGGGNGAQGATNITIKNCEFDATTKPDHNVICIIGAGDITVENSSFIAANINLKNIEGGNNNVTVKNTQFTNTVADNQNIRVRGYKENTVISITIDYVSFAGNSVKNIEIGQESNGTLSYNISNTDAKLNVYKSGETTPETTEVESSKTYKGTNGNEPTYVATVNGTGYASLADAIAAAQNGDTIYVSAGEYTTYGNTSPKKSLTFVGAGAGNTIWTIGDLSKNVGGEGNGDYSFDGCDTITFKNMTLKSNSDDYRGFIRVSNTIVEKCTLEGKTAYWGYNTATFTGCTFNAPEGDYALWDYSTKTMTFDGCEFNISGKGVNVYVEAGNAGSEARKVEAKDCTINSTKANKAFLNIKNSTQAYEVTLSGDNKVNGLDANSTTGSNLYQVETTEVTETSGKTVKVQEKATDGTLTTVYEVKAASTAVAMVGGVEYASLADAIAAAKDGETVTLTADINTPETSYYIQKSLTIDLGGKTLTGSGYDGVFNIEGENAVVRIKNGKIVAVEQTGTAGKYTMAVWACAAGCEVTLEDLDVSQQITHTDDKQMDMIYTSKGTIIINSGRFESGTPAWTLNCNDSAYKAGTAKIIVNGGTFVGYDPRNNTAEGEGTSFVATGVGIDKNADGTFTAKAGMTAQVMDAKGASVKAFATLAEAITAAARNSTVTLLADTRENVTIDKALTLDLNGHTLNGGTVKAKPALTITARTVTIKDSSEAQTGTIMREDTAENSGVSSHYVIDIQGNAWVMFESGIVKNGSGAGGTKGASLVRVGDDSVAQYPGLNIKGGTFTQDNFIVIKVDRGYLTLNGGTLNSANSYAIENWFRATIKGGTVNGAVSSWTYSSGSNSTLTISGGTINGDVTAVNYGSAEGKVAKVEITGGTVNGELDTRNYDPKTSELSSIDDVAKATIGITGGTFSSDPTKYLVAGSTVTPNSDGTFGVAKAYLAKVGDTSYYTMEEAFKAQTASGEPIVLLRDYTTGSTFNSGTVARVVDLNGHTWTCTGKDANSAAFEINNANASLTVKNGKIVSSQLVGLIPSAMGGTIKYDNSSLTFENVQMSTTATSGIETNGNNTNDTVTLKNSTLNVPNGFGIYFPSSGTLTLDNSTVNAKTMGVQVCAGSLSINEGSAVTVTGDAVPKTENDGAIQDGAAISIVNRIGYKGLGTVTVSGGTFTAKKGNSAIKAYNWENNTESKFTAREKVAVSGGTFSSEVSEDLCAEGFIPTKNADDTYGVKAGKYVAQIGSTKYETLEEAVATANDGDTVTLLADVTADVAINNNITLDLGGKTLTNTNSGKATITISAGTTATVKNGNVIGGASYYNIGVGTEVNSTANLTLEDVTATAGNTDSSMIDNWGTLTITSGTYTGGLNVVKSEEGSTLTINGGKFELNYAVNNKYNGVILSAGTTMITGGEFIQNATTPRWGHPQVVLAMQVDGYISKIEITGGTFTNNKSGESIFHGSGKANSSNFEVSGGTFKHAIPDSYCADGFIPTKNADGTYGVQKAMKGSEKNPYTLEELGAMTRAQYIAAQEALGDTMYVEVGNYSYGTNGVLGNGVRNDTPGQTPDHSKLNAYGENGYLGDKNDGANGKNIIFVGGSVTSGVTGYASIDTTGTSLLLAVPAYTNVTFEGVTFKNVISFDYQLYTSPWSQLGELKFSGCTFNGIIVGAIAAQTLTFDGCTFTAYKNTASENNSNPTWIRPAYGNWTKGDNEGQGNNFKSLTTINFINNKVTSTRPVKFERIAQWEMDTKVSVKNNKVTISAQEGDTSTKNVGFYFGANAKFDLTLDGNEKLGTTSALYTGVYTAPNGESYAGLPAGSTVKDSKGTDVEATDALVWKTTDALTLKTTTEAVEVAGVKFATLEEAYAAAANGDTITLLEDCKSDRINLEDKSVTVVLNGKTLTSTAAYGVMFCAKNGNKITIDGNVEGSKLVGTLMITAETDGHIEVNGGTYESSLYCPIYVNGAVNSENSTVTVKNAIINATNSNSNQDMGCAVYLAGYSTSVFENCTITAPVTGIEIRAGKLTLNNCDVTGGNGKVTADANGNGTTVTNAALAISQHTTKKPIDVTINGGTFNGTAAVYQTDVQGTGSADVKIAVKSGTFDGTISGETDGAIVISDGKFLFKVDDKYFEDGYTCSGKAGADNYYTVVNQPIESFGVTIGEGLSLRIYVDAKYRNGKLLIKYTTVGSNPEVEYEAKISSVIEKVDGNAAIRYCARIFGITPQMADVIIKVQYVDENDVAIGSEKEVSILKYCQNYVKEDSPEAVKTFVSKMLEYCASAMDYRMVTNEDQIYLGYTWKQRADALRAEKVDICGEDKVKYEFDLKKLGTYTNIGTTFKTRGMVYDNIIRIYFAIPSAEFNSGYKYYMNSNEIHPTYNKSKDQWEFSFTIAPYEYCNSIRITIKDGEDEIGEYACSLAIILESFSRKSGDAETDALAKLSVAAYEYCRSLADYPTSKDFNH